NEEESESSSEQERKRLDYNAHVFLLTGDHPEIVKVCNIKYIESDSEYSRVFTSDGKKHYVRRLLKVWEEILPSEEFLRIHRSTIINLSFVKNMEKWFNNSYRVFLNGVDDPFIISRRFSARLRSRLNL
ncbi:MAG: LytR/AlgR family response regulator transcription factor, partial [Bacillota bacterium]